MLHNRLRNCARKKVQHVLHLLKHTTGVETDSLTNVRIISTWTMSKNWATIRDNWEIIYRTFSNINEFLTRNYFLRYFLIRCVPHVPFVRVYHMYRLYVCTCVPCDGRTQKLAGRSWKRNITGDHFLCCERERRRLSYPTLSCLLISFEPLPQLDYSFHTK